MKRIIDDVKKKKELGSVPDALVKKLIQKEFQSNVRLEKFIKEHEPKTLHRSEKYKKFIRNVRAKLRRIYGVFSTKISNKREKFLVERDYDSILKSHVSTRERMKFYEELYNCLWEITGKPKKIIDISCGMNPFSYKYLKNPKTKYFATELSPVDVDFINRFFKQEKIKGRALELDLLEATEADLENLPESDVCFMFKVLDTIENMTKGHALSKKIIQKIPARWIVVSFPTKTITQKEMKNINYKWLEKICDVLGYETKKLKFENEVFYVIKK